MLRNKLPMNPWLFIVLYILLLAIGAWGIQQGIGWLLMLADVSAMGLQLLWIFQASQYSFRSASEEFGASEKRAKQKRFLIGALIGLIASFLALMLELCFLLMPNPATGIIDNDPRALPFMVIFFLSFFILIFQTAKILCEAEAKETGERIFVTCLLLFYIVIGAPFLFRRLRRLEPTDG